MAIQTGVNVSKAVAYAVLGPPQGVLVAKAVSYVILAPEAAIPPSWGSWSFPNGTVSIYYTYEWDMPGSTAPMTYTLQSGSLPDGLTLTDESANLAKISGTPTVAGDFTFTLRASNLGGTADKEFTITISAFSELDYPSEDDVRDGVSYANGDLTGNMTEPAVTDVRSSVTYGTSGTEYTGTLTLPAVSSVLSTASYGAGGTEFTGTVTLPAVSNVRSGVTFGASLALTGTVTLPAESDVRSTIQYGAGGTEFTGTYTATGGGGGGSWTWG